MSEKVTRMSGVGAWPKAGPGLTATLATGIALAVSLAVFQPFFYHENDDAAINQLAAGAQGGDGTPSEYLVFTHIIVGRILKVLYTSAPRGAWYGVYLTVLNCIAAWTVAYAGARVAVGLAGRVTSGIAGAMVLVIAVTNLQFTISAALLSGSTIALAFSGLECRPRTRVGAASLFIGGFLLAWVGVMVRWHAGCLGVVCVLPLLGLWSGAHWYRWVAIPASLACWFAGSVLLEECNQTQYAANPAWAEIYEYQKLRALFMDWGRVQYSPENQAAFDSVGWSRNDHAMLVNWFFLDDEVFGIDNLRALSERAHRSALRPATAGSLVGAALSASNVILVGWAALLAIALPIGRWPGRLWVVCVGLWPFALVMLISVVFRPPPLRVTLPIWTLSMLLPLFYLLARGKPGVGFGKVLALLPALIVAAVVSRVGWAAVVRTHALEEQALAVEAELRQIAGLRGNPLVVDWGDAFHAQLTYRPFDRNEAYAALPMIHIGWGTRLEPNRLMLKSRGIGDLHRALFTRDDVLIGASEDRLAILRTYLWEHYGVHTTPETVFRGRYVTLYRLRCPARNEKG